MKFVVMDNVQKDDSYVLSEVGHYFDVTPNTLERSSMKDIYVRFQSLSAVAMRCGRVQSCRSSSAFRRNVLPICKSKSKP